MSITLCPLFIAFISFSVLYAQIRPHRLDCSKYLYCDGGCKVKYCPSGMEFNPDHDVFDCDTSIAERMGCRDRIDQYIDLGKEYQGGHVFMPHPDNRTKYLECHKRLGGCRSRECDSGKEFNAKSYKCTDLSFQDELDKYLHDHSPPRKNPTNTDIAPSSPQEDLYYQYQLHNHLEEHGGK